MLKKSIQQMCVPAGGSLRDVLLAVHAGGAGIAVIIDSDERLAGVMTDGDVRRALLSGALLSDGFLKYINCKVLTLLPGSSRAEAIDLMQAMHIDQIPIVDEIGKVHGIHLLHELLGAVERPNWAVILAGGKGTRLGELTKSVPKPMLKVAGRPILERLVFHFLGFGIRRIFLAVNYLSEVIEDHFGDGERFGCRIEYLREIEPLGTGGALSMLPETPAGPIFVCNGDLVTQANLEDMLCFHESGGFGMTVGLHEYTHQIPYGCLQIAEGKVVQLSEKPTIVHPINAGIYVIDPSLVETVPREFYPMTELIEKCLLQQIPVGAWNVTEDWIDVGRKDELFQARNGSV